jgi:hypothetical protein
LLAHCPALDVIEDEDMLAEVEEEFLTQEPQESQEMHENSVGPADGETHPALRKVLNEYLQVMTSVAENASSGELPWKALPSDDIRILLSLCRKAVDALQATNTGAECFQNLITEIDAFMSRISQSVLRSS